MNILRRLFGDILRLYAKREKLNAEEFQSKNGRLGGRIETLIFNHGSKDKDVKRIADRLTRSMEGLFTFLDEEGVEPTNNHAEREMQSAVIIRKNSIGNRSEKGASCQALLLVYRTM